MHDNSFKDKICDNCRPYFEVLEKEVESLKERLVAYENAHTPPSKQRFLKRGTSHRHKKNGRPEGYPGSTRKIPTPDRTINLTAKKCPYCKSRRIKLKNVERRIIEDIPEPVQTKVTEFIVHHYSCDNCKKEFGTRHKDLPDEGRFGNNILTQVTLMKFHDRIPFRKIKEALKRQYGLEITHSSVLDFTHRVSLKARKEYDIILKRLRLSGVVYVDETSIKVNGKKYWIWIFVTANDTTTVIRKSRGGDVLEEVLGGYQGIIVCDGWKVYPMFTDRLQRCWAHLLREVDFLSRNVDEATVLSDGLHNLYNTLTNLLDTGPPDRSRSIIKMKAEETMKELITVNYQSKDVQKIITKIKNGFDHWFTFVENPGVEPTNNRAERALREHIVQRKIIGTLRNEKGTFIHETMMSVLATWKQQGYNTYEKLIETLRS